MWIQWIGTVLLGISALPSGFAHSTGCPDPLGGSIEGFEVANPDYTTFDGVFSVNTEADKSSEDSGYYGTLYFNASTTNGPYPKGFCGLDSIKIALEY